MKGVLCSQSETYGRRYVFSLKNLILDRNDCEKSGKKLWKNVKVCVDMRDFQW